MKKVGLGASLTRIGAESFTCCPAMSKMSIPQTLSKIESDAFGDLSFLDADGN